MFKKKIADVQVQQLESALKTWRVLAEFFEDNEQLRPGEGGRDFIARRIGITREEFDTTHRVLRSIAAGRVIPRDVIARGE